MTRFLSYFSFIGLALMVSLFNQSTTFAADITTELATEIPIRGNIVAGNFGEINYSWGADPYTIETNIVGSEPYLDTTTMRLHGVVWTTNFGWFSFDYDGLEVTLEPATPGDTDLFNIVGQGWGPNYGYIEFTGLVQYDRLLTDAGFPDEGAGKFVGDAWSPNVGLIPMDSAFLDITPYDPTEVTLGTAEIFAAQLAKNITITVADDGADIADVEAVIQKSTFDGDETYTVPYTSGVGAVFSHDFPDVDLFGVNGRRDYPATFTINDRSGNKTIITTDFGVVAGAPHFAVDFSEVTLNTDTGPKVALQNDDSQYDFFLHLEDQFNNTIRDVAGVKNVELELIFQNTVNKNQFLETILGNAIRYASAKFGIDEEGSPLNTTFTLLGALAPDGEYDLSVRSMAPTSDVYPHSPNSILALQSAQLTIAAQAGLTSIGEGLTDIQPLITTSANFSYLPALSNTLTLQPGFTNFREGGITFFDLLSQAAVLGAEVVTAIENEVVFQPEDPLFEFTIQDDAASETDPLGIDTYSLLGASGTHYNELDEDIGPVSASFLGLADVYPSSFGETRLQTVTPTSLLGGTTEPITVDVLSRLAYRVNGEVIAHPGFSIADLSVVPASIEIIGKVRTDYLGPLGQAVNNIGDIAFESIRTAMRRNTLQLTKGLTVPAGGQLPVWDNDSPHAFRDGEIFYFQGNTEIGQLGGDLIVPPGRHTIIVTDGHLKILGNISYTDETSSLGIMVVSSTPGALYNLYLHPDVAEIVGAYYIEGSILSLRGAGFDHFDGFTTLATDLLTPITITGRIHSYNTVGGSRLNPPELPSIVNMPAAYRGETDDLKKKQQLFSMGYDLFFLRRGDGISTAVKIEYDPRLETLAPYGFAIEQGGETQEIVR